MAKSLNITSVDFDTIKQNLKTFLESQSEFTDYDFEGSGLSVLLDILAYNTHYNAFYANMAINELFIDSAVKRESVVSIAKLLNYIPRSVRSAEAIIDVTVTGVVGSPTSLLIDRYTAFTSTINDQSYTFYNVEPATIVPNGSDYSYSGLSVFEGNYVANKYNVVAAGPDEKYVIPNKDVDTSTIFVTVQDSAGSTSSTTFTLFDGDITSVTGTTNIYYLQQNIDGYYEVYFGDGVLGTRLSAGNQVTIEYLVSSGTAANVSDKVNQTMSLSGTISGYGTATVVVTTKSNTGQDEESIDEIRFNAPRAATAQGRLITQNDYEAFLKNNYSFIDDVSIWGGEDNDPPAYGKVFISVLPKTGQFLTTTRKNTITNAIKTKRALAITPKFVDPEVFYASVYALVKYNPNVTNESASDIQEAVTDAINNYFSNNLGSFGDYFSASKLIAAIDDAKTSILSNLTTIYVEKRFTPSLSVSYSDKIKLNNIINEGSIQSTQFYYQNNGLVYAARIDDVPDAATVSGTGTYRRSGSVITCTFDTEHGLTEGEVVTLGFSGSATDGTYTVDTVTSDFVFTVISASTGNETGTVTVESAPRGRLRIYDVATNSVLNSDIGFVSYDAGIIQITDLTVYGYLADQNEISLYFTLSNDSQDISVLRNQIIRISSVSANADTNRLAGVSVSVTAIPK